jgi:TolB protein
VWSPDGRRILISRYVPGSGDDLWSMRPDGTDRRLVRHTPALSERSGASWSPDGRRIVFGASDRQVNLRICTMNSNGTGLRRLTEGHSAYPDWSPDGRRIVFYSCLFTSCALTSMSPDGSDQRPLGQRGLSDIQPDVQVAASPG